MKYSVCIKNSELLECFAKCSPQCSPHVNNACVWQIGWMRTTKLRIFLMQEFGHWSLNILDGYNERVVDRLPLMTYGLKLSLEAWILKLKKKIFNNVRFNELQLHFGNSNFFVKLRYVKYILTKIKIHMQALSFRDYLKLK